MALTLAKPWRVWGWVFLGLTCLALFIALSDCWEQFDYLFTPPAYPRAADSIVAVEEVQRWGIQHNPRRVELRAQPPLTSQELAEAHKKANADRILASIQDRGCPRRAPVDVPGSAEVLRLLDTGVAKFPPKSDLPFAWGVLVMGRDKSGAQVLALSAADIRFRVHSRLFEFIYRRNSPREPWQAVELQRIWIKDDVDQIMYPVGLFFGIEMLIIAVLVPTAALVWLYGYLKRRQRARPGFPVGPPAMPDESHPSP